LGEENTIVAAEVFLTVKILKTGKASGCEEIRTEMLVFSKGTERLADGGDDPPQKVRQERTH